ncbi:alpha/beta fold hydrolase [Dyella acidiphila]|uniref:Alpha/beta hydrolase n=1 Tax=Dyella acidiphila TaxID=2775866 RepID=A0ABR9GCG6_9GAMM|nr:alpha/beta hydrolase [Dyella acidiphila]MBE1161731.1 alpha/beta hydrolase [Dyella acidiphila]
MSSVSSQDLLITTPQGRLFATRWDPPGDDASRRAAIVLLHDSLGCVALWRDFPAELALATGRCVIAYDRLGFGRSDPHAGKLDRHFVDAEAHGGFRHLREALQLERFVAFGHSVGGGMAVACAAAHGAHCTALITESAQAFVEDRTIRGILAAQQAFQSPGQLERLAKYHGDKAAWVLSAWIDTWLAPDFADWQLDEDLRRVSCPALAIHGELDEYGSVRHPERIAALVAGPSHSLILPACGHVPHREQPPAVIDAARHWLAAVA